MIVDTQTGENFKCIQPVNIYGSNGADKFLQEFKIKYEIQSTNWMAPSAFMIKKVK